MFKANIQSRTGLIAAACGVALLAGASGAGAQALEETASERDVLKACEKKICEIVVKKDASGPDFACTLTKTWAKDKIKEGIEKKRLSWSLGNARCVIDVGMKRADILEAISKPTHTIDLPPQTVKCQVEREKDTLDVSVTLAPKIQFKAGKAEKAWLGVKNIEAPTVIRGAIWTVAQAEDYFGLFHTDMVAEINEFTGQKCTKAMAGN
jgi:hypothetical protein